MSTIQRLAEGDVRAIFDCLHGGRPLPEGLKFQIVPVGPSGLKLSPPAIEFENGLYVLLRPGKKDKPKSRLPPHLLQYLVEEVPGQACPWSLSGPQFTQPTEFQQRYCYPKGNHNYSCLKGGALWTMYDSKGKEDLNYRLLHVYFSAKRAGIRSATPSPARRRRRITTPTSVSSSGSSSTMTRSPATPNVVPTSPWPSHGSMHPPHPYWHNHHPHYPMVPATLVHPTPPPMRPVKHYLPPPTPPPPPTGSALKRRKVDIPTPPPTRSMMPTTTTAAFNYDSTSNSTRPHVFVEKVARMPALQDEDEDAWWMMNGTSGGGPILEAPELGLLDHEDEMAIRTKLSFELLPLSTVEDSRMDNLFLLDSEERTARAKMAEYEAKSKKDGTSIDPPPSLQKRLEVLHRQLLEWIQQQPKEKQPRLHQMVRQWAQKLHSDLKLEEEEGDKKMAATVPAAPSNNNNKTTPLPTTFAIANTRVPVKMEASSSDDTSTPSKMESV